MLSSTDFEVRNSIWTRNAEREANVAKDQLAEAQQRIASLEEALKDRDKSRNALKAVACAVRDELIKIAPNHPLAEQKNREKIYDAHFKL